ncbi:hypothetical protein FKW77_010728 [Venturia effusa]|uniref:Uncharacterized protein n=1 Tax=Venturia effusa TaxID=50376 RepID=A0A517KYA0_9PEZI|nr:hypothetical protein FKW77_010728 [Venturia effusa]
MSSTLILKRSESSLAARLPQERRLYQVNALPNPLLSPQQKPPEYVHVEATTLATTPKRWKRLSATGLIPKRSSWSSMEVLSISKQNTTPSWDEKRQKGTGLGERIKHLLSSKWSTEVHPGQFPQSPTIKIEPVQPKSEFPAEQRQSSSLEKQIAEFGSKMFGLTPLDEFALLAVSAPLPNTSESGLGDTRPSTSLFNLTAGLKNPVSPPSTVTTTTTISINEKMTASQPLPDRLSISKLRVKNAALTPRQHETCQSEGHPTSSYDANASELATLDSIVDFFESFGAGFCWNSLGQDTIGIAPSPDIRPMGKPRVFRQLLVAEPA